MYASIYIQMKLLLFDPRFSPMERLATRTYIGNSGAKKSTLLPPPTLITPTSPTSPTNGGIHTGPLTSSSVPYTLDQENYGFRSSSHYPTNTSFMWGIWQCGDEITLLLEESDTLLFPEGALQVSPQHWRIIKLSGRAIDFDETGIVSSMSQVESGIPALNISTATTNCTLVPEELLVTTLSALSMTMKLPVEEDPYEVGLS